ncbi:MAG TPA: hypothetical protein VD997_08265 [Phycisphaerales bacterium]|nr:hypothetical protein [Phycisphaerales bacterium]
MSQLGPIPQPGHGVRQQRESNVPPQQVREITEEEMAAHSPDGRVPDPRSRGRGRNVFWIVLGIGVPLVLGTVIYIGGMPALLMGLVYVAVFAAVAFPVWYAGMMRKREETEAKHIVQTTLDENQDRSRAA